ncbi:SSI family serine proteinase inhibitor [Nonomuraea rubra]|uniref:SSI family serine proteinase inhibitor n=1 Tax=Nonomuraea rubra TaxID=46180 RepID=UPI0033FE2D2D
MRRSLSVVCAAIACVLPSASPVHAAPKENGLFLMVSGKQGTWLRAIGIYCPGRADQHPYGRVVCDLLADVDGDFNRLPGDAHLCTDEKDPVTATATGTWGNRRISWKKTFSSACLLDEATAPVFRF